MNENIKYCPYLFCKYSFGFNQQLVSTPYYRMTIHKYITGFGGKTSTYRKGVFDILIVQRYMSSSTVNINDE